jgi:hypothetical protein
MVILYVYFFLYAKVASTLGCSASTVKLSTDPAGSSPLVAGKVSGKTLASLNFANGTMLHLSGEAPVVAPPSTASLKILKGGELGHVAPASSSASSSSGPRKLTKA